MRTVARVQWFNICKNIAQFAKKINQQTEPFVVPILDRYVPTGP